MIPDTFFHTRVFSDEMVCISMATPFLIPLVLFLFAITCAYPTVGQTVPNKETTESQNMNNTSTSKIKDELRALVEALANKNQPPKHMDNERHTPIFDKDFDWIENQRVWNAIKTLIEREEDAWPEIVSHLDDERYCITITSESGYHYSFSVGDMCRDIIGRNLSRAYLQRMKPFFEITYARYQWPEIARDKKALKSWCAQRSKNNLYELQIEMCEWVLNELKTTDDLPPHITNNYLSIWVADIATEIKTLKEKKTAAPFRGYGLEEYVPFDKKRAEDIRK
jgi:hypothetical protein